MPSGGTIVLTPSGDGTDDALRINAALSDPSITTVQLGAGTFSVQTPIFVPSGKTLLGAGTDDTMIKATDDFSVPSNQLNGVVVTELGATDVTLSDFSVDANKVLPGDIRLNGVFMKEAVDFAVSGVTVYNATGYGHFAQGHLEGFPTIAEYAGGTYEDCAVYNSQVCFEQMFADGVTLINCVAGDGDGDIPIEAYFHALAGARNISYIDCSASGYAQHGIDIASIVDPARNIRIIDCDIETFADSGLALIASATLPTYDLIISGSRFSSHGYTAAMLGGVTGTATNTVFEGTTAGALFQASANGTDPNYTMIDSQAVGLGDPTDGATVYGVIVQSGSVVWQGGSIEARGAEGLMSPLGGPVTLTGGATLVARGFDVIDYFVEGDAPIGFVAPSVSALSGLGALGGGGLTVDYQDGATPDDRLAIANIGNGAGQIGVSGNVVRYQGVAFATFSGGAGGTSLQITFGSAATPAAVEALARALTFSSVSEDPSLPLRLLSARLVDAAGHAATFSAALGVEPVAGLLGTAAADTMTGDAGANGLFGYGGNDVLDGAGGADRMAGGSGDDTYYVDDAGDVVIESGGGGQDTLYASVSYALVAGSAVELLSVKSTAGTESINLTANERAQTLIGNEGDNVLLGRGGVDILNGLGGHDTLDGGGGADVMDGGAGNDSYAVDDAGDVIVEAADGGYDSVYASSSYTLAPQLSVESLSAANLYARDAIDLVGNGLDNSIYGNDGNNRLDGGGGIDILYGYGGDDILVVDGNEDLVVETVGGGYDTLLTRQSYVLGDALEIEVLAFVDAAAGQSLNLTGNGFGQLIRGNAGVNALVGGAGNDTLDGGAGADTLTGGDGNDLFYLDEIGDQVVELAEGGNDGVFSAIDYTLGANLENLTLTGSGALTGVGNDLANQMAGNSGANLLDGGGGDDRLDGGLGADLLRGGLGNDFYVVDHAGDAVAEAFDSGIDTVRASVSVTLWAEVEKLELSGSAAINGIGNALANSITGNDGANVLDGMTGADILVGGWGNDIYVVDDAGDVTRELAGQGSDTVESRISWTLGANIENLELTGGAAIDGTGNGLANVLTGNYAANILSGGAGNDTLDGGLGADRLEGGLGNDVYLADTSDTLVELAGGGTDTVIIASTHTLGANFENLSLRGTYNVNGTGNALANQLSGNSGNNVLDGDAGADVMLGGYGDDSYIVDDLGDRAVETYATGGNDSVASSVSFNLEAYIENLVLTGSYHIDGTGTGFANLMIGNSGGNRLDGGAGADTLRGGLGNDTYIVDDVGDVTEELAGEGIDAVESIIGWTLAANIETLRLTGGAAIDGTGNGLANWITGNYADNLLAGGDGNDTLDGGIGADTLVGGTGNDIYYADTSDALVELAGQGVDTVFIASSHVLGANFDNLALTGTWNVDGTGNALANQLSGNAGNNVLDGGAGADLMLGGLGNDIYVVDHLGDRARETSASGGNDIVRSAVSFNLEAYVETLFLTGTAHSAANGNGLANLMVGNAGGNRLNGMAGADTLRGGLGNDTYIVDNIGDVTEELAWEGTDAVESSIAWTLAANIENLRLTGGAAIDATGNALANAITGNYAANILLGGDGNDTLDGGIGADRLDGGHGDDIYYADTSDTLVEAAGAGIDTVFIASSHTLGANFENLALTGSAAVNGTGNALANRISGNSGNNVLDGGAGADLMLGGLGNDTYVVDNVGDRARETSDTGGTDTVRSSVSFGLEASVEHLVLTGSANVDGTGNVLANQITGNAGNNLLFGGSGDDVIAGGNGADRLYGGLGYDSLTGGTGADAFCFDTAPSAANADRLTDFRAADDTIFLSRTQFAAAGPAGTLASAAFTIGAAAVQADDRIVYDQATGDIFYDADGSGAGAAILFAEVTAGTALTHLDFQVYIPGA